MRLIITLLCLLYMYAPHAHAAEKTLDYSAFKRIPILHDGRVKPLDTFARVYLYRLHGSETLDGNAAIEWLAASIFRPDLATDKPFIRIADRHLAKSLGLEADRNTLFTYRELEAAFKTKRSTIIALINKGEANLNKQEAAFLDFYSAINDYSHITRALTLVLPAKHVLSDTYARELGISGETQSYLDLLSVKDQVVLEAEKAAKQHGARLELYSEKQQQAALLAFYFDTTEATGRQNHLFRVVPAFLSDKREWFAPWALINNGHGSPKGSEILAAWQTLAEAYHTHNTALWHNTSTTMIDATREARGPSNMQLGLEVTYHQLNPYLWLLLGYGAVFVALLYCNVTAKAPHRWVPGLFVATIILHTITIIARMVVLERPPVSTLYESVLFVALISAIFGLMMDRRHDSSEGTLIGSLLGLGLLAISGLFADPGDSLGVLVAVLNTNFWLATHVVVITVGYGCAMVAGTMAHVYLLTLSDHLRKKLHTTALIALLFTAIGTILGGIWADQSWGRFWGWDPKENGALAIVLWLVWLLHGRITGHLGALGFAALLAVTNIVVALSWFGVNLLSVGLHSYGFTNEAAYGLAAFCLGEMMVIIALAIYAKKRRHHAA